MTTHARRVPPGLALNRTPRAGEVLHVGPAASVQFAVPILFRVIRGLDRSTYEGWIWLRGYELTAGGTAVDQRDIWVQVRGLRWLNATDPR